MKTAAEVATFAQVGDMIWTNPLGEWPGGYARITELAPDPGAPEIVFNVAHISADIQAQFGDMGVFENELVMTLTRHGPSL